MTHSESIQVASELKRRINGKAYMTIHRTEITRLLREVCGRPAARLGSRVAEEIEAALSARAVRVFPSLAAGTDAVRLYHTDTLAVEVLDWFLHPGPESDVQLAHLLTKLKGRWVDSRQEAA